MSTRYDDDRDYDRDAQYYGQYNRRSDSEYGRSFNDRSFSDRPFGDRSSGEGSQSRGRYSGGGGYSGGSSGRGRESERYGREGRYGGSESGGGYSGRGQESQRYGREGGGYSSGEYGGGYSGRESERYGREGRYSGGAEGHGRSSSERGRDYQSGRENYWGEGWENERDYDTSESRYGSYRGISGGERGYGEGSSGYGQGSRNYTQRYNYPTGYRSGQSYSEPGRGYDYDRGSNRGEDRGWWDRASDEVASWFGDEEAERRRRMDAQRQHRGRGPKGYRRSDERIKEDVNDRLSDDYSIDASDIEVMVTNTEVTLSGTVNSREDKRRAEDIAESVSGVTNVENRLRVKRGDRGSYTSTGTGTGASMGTTGSTGTSTGASTGTGTSSGVSGTGTGTGSSVTGTPGSTTSSAAAGGGKSSGD
ncbi:MAG TPA: BON domain-containing protein [Pyrinomonadaceae bacterium]